MNKKQNFILLLTLILVLLIINYPYLDYSLEKVLNQNEEVHVDRVIDGDTIESNGTSIRLLGINSPERGEIYSDEAKDFLESLILNENVTLEFVGEKQDKYYRTLAYVFHNGENINIEMVRNGFANYYFYSGRDKYSDDLISAWQVCLNNEVHMCEFSTHPCSQCIIISEAHLTNSCEFECNVEGWIVKSEGRDKVIFNDILDSEESFEFELDLSDSSGSLFLRDDHGKLVQFLE